MHVRVLIPVSILATAWLASCAHCPADAPRRIGGITSAEIGEITPVIRAKTSECILYFRRLERGVIEVETGNSGYQGVGQLFHVRRSGGHWKIIKELIWTA